ncbi:MAG: 4Fe-4S dicluster domain-containing protein [Candidatus Zixiibacteriota bacterium]
MTDTTNKIGEKLVLTRDQLPQLFKALQKSGYTLIGPTIRDHAIVNQEIDNCVDLPEGYSDQQDAAAYRLSKTDKTALFDYNVATQSFKRFLFIPRHTILRAKRKKKTFEVADNKYSPSKMAFIGVRPCELHAIYIQDRVFTAGEFIDEQYQKQRDQIFLVVVNCTKASKSCFCTSMETGPQATTGFDLALTEIAQPGKHFFVLEIGSEQARTILSGIKCKPASQSDIDAADAAVASAAAQIERTLDTTGIKELFLRNIDNVYWDKVGGRCMSCANCTLVCPTCFCSTVEDVTDLSGDNAERARRWDSCFTMDFSYIHGGSVRPSSKARYRQWITHKLAAWQDQFGSSGCVGCGRCITWCPVGIDITEEARTIRERDIKPATVTEKTEV